MRASVWAVVRSTALAAVAAAAWAIGYHPEPAIAAEGTAKPAAGVAAKPTADVAAKPGAHRVGVAVHGAWIREAPPGAEVLAAYLEIRNTGAKADTLFEVKTPIAEIVSIHRTVVAGGVAKMEHLESLPIPARSTVRLRPGGDHLMIMFPERVPRAGQKVSLALRFRRSGTVWLEVPVRSAVD